MSRLWAPPTDDRGRPFRFYDPASRVSKAGRAEFPKEEFNLVVERVRRADPEFSRKSRRWRWVMLTGTTLVIITILLSPKGWTDVARLVWYATAAGFSIWIGYWMFPTNRPDVVRRAMLRDSRCPGCAYKLVSLPVETDGCTVCPECGTAWKLPLAGS